MSTGQKYRRTEFEDQDDNNSTGDANSPGVVYNPVIAFRAASFSGGRGGLVGRGCCARRSGLEKLLLAVVAALAVVVVVLLTTLTARGQPVVAPSTDAVSARLHASQSTASDLHGDGRLSVTHLANSQLREYVVCCVTCVLLFVLCLL